MLKASASESAFKELPPPVPDWDLAGVVFIVSKINIISRLYEIWGHWISKRLKIS
jgi:hypothetical protein